MREGGYRVVQRAISRKRKQESIDTTGIAGLRLVRANNTSAARLVSGFPARAGRRPPFSTVWRDSRARAECVVYEVSTGVMVAPPLEADPCPRTRGFVIPIRGR